MRKDKVLYTILSLLLIIIIIFCLIKIKNYKKLLSEIQIYYENVATTEVLYNTNYLILNNLNEIVCLDVEGNKTLLSNYITNPTIIMLLSENSCSICVENAMAAFDNVFGTGIKPEILVLYKNLSLRELNFRNEIFSEAKCFSVLEEPLEFGVNEQILLFVDGNMLIRNALLPFTGMSEDMYNTFFQNIKNYISNY